MKEIWDLYDVHRDLTGETWVRGTKAPIPRGKYHVVVSIWTYTPEGKILITRRHPGKSFGGLWENTGGAVISGESSLEAACRELLEETGIKPAADRLRFLGDVWHSGCIVDAYLYISDVDVNELTLQDGEVTEARLVTEDELDLMSKQGKVVPSVYRTFCCYRNDIKSVLGV